MSACIHRATASWTDFLSKDQICRAVDSISNNIAEGAEHESKAEFKRFLSYAKASAGETKYHECCTDCLAALVDKLVLYVRT
mgnify:CR=1 FL=1